MISIRRHLLLFTITQRGRVRVNDKCALNPDFELLCLVDRLEINVGGIVAKFSVDRLYGSRASFKVGDVSTRRVSDVKNVVQELR